LKSSADVSGSAPLNWNEGRSIHIGVNDVDDALYQGWLAPLESSEQDAREMRDLADAMGCSTRLLLSEEATRETAATALESTIERLVPGDFLLISYSGHMTTLAGVGDDVDGWDEAWCLHDGILLDDEFHDLLSDVPEDCDVLVVTDSCFAGGAVDGRSNVSAQDLLGAIALRGQPSLGAVLRRAKIDRLPDFPPGGPPGGPAGAPAVFREATTDLPTEGALTAVLGSLRQRAPKTRLGDLAIGQLVRQGVLPRGVALPASQRRPISARVVALSAAAEGSLAFEGDELGLFTAALLETVDFFAGEAVTYGQLMEVVADILPIQGPTLGVFGGATQDAARRTAFAADSAGQGVLTRKHRGNVDG
jgi:caspase domain-containing protein